MLDVEKVKTILQTAVNEREEARILLEVVSSTGNKNLTDIYERRYRRYCSRFGGMCDMLFQLGYSAWSDENDVFVEKRYGDNYVDDDDEVPF